MEMTTHTVTTHAVATRDGRTLHVERVAGPTASAETPTVVFESGMGASHHMWGAVIPLVTRFATVVVYDRSGLGASPPDERPRTLARLADDLVDVLSCDVVGAGPVVLVGHSWGGPIVRSAAALLPERIAGIVLVDQTDEGCELFFSKANERQTKLLARVMPGLARIGLVRFLARGLAARLPEPSASGLRRDDTTVAAVRTQQAELATHVDDLRRLRDHPLLLPIVPVAIISGAKTSPLERGRRSQLIEAHRARAAALPKGRHVLAAGSSHYVPLTEPTLIADEIRRIVAPS